MTESKPQTPTLTIAGFHAVAVGQLLHEINGPQRETVLLAIGAHVALAAADGVKQGSTPPADGKGGSGEVANEKTV